MLLFDCASRRGRSRPCDRLGDTLDALVAKGKLDADVAEAILARIEPVTALEEVGSVGLVVEAIVENLEAKRALFQQLEALVPAGCRAGHQHLVDLGHRDRQRPAASAAAWSACTSSTRCR